MTEQFLVKATRFISNVRREGLMVSFDLVVRDEINSLDFGSGRVKLLASQLNETNVEEAVQRICVEGEGAYPKEKAPGGKDDQVQFQRLQRIAAILNIRDNPNRRNPFGVGRRGVQVIE